MEAAEEAIRRVGVEPVRSIIRGGTDGACLSAKGLPTPNIFTGGQHYHSVREWASVQDMAAAAATVVELARVWAEAHRPSPEARWRLRAMSLRSRTPPARIGSAVPVVVDAAAEPSRGRSVRISADQRQEGAALVPCQLVLDPRGRLGVAVALDDALGLERSAAARRACAG